MSNSTVPGYAGKFLRVDLTSERITEETFDEATLRQWVGGAGIGARILYEEVPPGVEWSDPANRIIIASGPLAATRLAGSGTYSVATKGPLTNGAVLSQANGFFGAFLKFSGFDGIILQGAASRWLYLHIHDGVAELKDAGPLVGQDTWQMQDSITTALGKKESDVSVVGIGPAGENLVKFAAIAGDKGHVAGHNGTGAVLGSKKLKAIVAERGKARVVVKDSKRLAELAKEIIEFCRDQPDAIGLYEWGTSMVLSPAHAGGWLPVKNYTTNLFPYTEPFMGENFRKTHPIKRNPCWACPTTHLHMMEITEGPHKGFVGEEPEYEQWAAWGPQIGVTDPDMAFVLSNTVDRLGIETNEAGWVAGFVMECYEKGILTKEDLGGLEATWGNGEAVLSLLHMIARREGIGDLLAEGVMRAAQKLGGNAPQMAIYTLKGTTPRGHDHRGRWSEMVDTSFSNTGTIESGIPTYIDEFGVDPRFNAFDPDAVVDMQTRIKGRMVFIDSLGVCHFCLRCYLRTIVEALNAATGWDMTFDEAVTMGRKVVHLLRAFNLRHGISPEMDAPSPRYGSTPVDGPASGVAIGPHWAHIRAAYYEKMGWDAEGRPTPETLGRYGLTQAIRDLYPEQPVSTSSS
ncbi:MAG: hypothetical protein M1370_03935 [Bacteroidetes bacterium]|nr:hypothetical protein [Bacteroidota bacterium]MCL5026359.1 hypothetical protein [Chloroflexota bacterium]